MVTFALIKDGQAVSNKRKRQREKLNMFQKMFLQEMSTEIVLNSPVDTGAYMEAHTIGTSGPVTSSRGKPKNQPYEPNADSALSRLFTQIDSLPDISDTVSITNNAVHAREVEYSHGYAPYSSARRNASAIAKQVGAKIEAL